MSARLISALALTTLGACSPEPRSASFFAAHADEAAKVVADCKAGPHRGQECVNAEVGLASAKRDARMDAYRKGF